MKLLCDHNVNEKYTDTFRRMEWLTVVTVRDELSADADDPDISEYADRHMTTADKDSI